MAIDRPEGDAAPGVRTWKPVLGLSDESRFLWRCRWPKATVYDQPEPEELLELTVIVPARNEEERLGPACNRLSASRRRFLPLGGTGNSLSWTITRPIAPPILHGALPEYRNAGGQAGEGLDGKEQCNLDGGAKGSWALAAVYGCGDTVHEPGDLHRAMHEAARHNAGVLSYSPRQIVSGLAQRTLMPLVFSELALAYPPAKVSDPEPANRRSEWAVSAGRAGGLSATGWSRRGCRQGSGRCGIGVSGQAAKGGPSVSLRRRCRRDKDVQHDRGND